MRETYMEFLKSLLKFRYSRAILKYNSYLKKWKSPAAWCSRYPLANGKFQSPVDIETHRAQYDPFLERAHNPIVFDYKPIESYRLLNDGTTLKVVPNRADMGISGGPLSIPYKFDHFHFHWGSDGTKGSEHRINGRSYDGEVHFVHWNNKNFQTLSDACSYYQGLCVLGVFLKKGKTNPEYDKFIQYIPNITHYKDYKEIDERLDLFHLLPEDLTQYWTYPGSLTTPPFSETVTWVVFKNPVEISADQLSKLFTLKSSELDDEGNCKVMSNIYRDPQPLNERIVRRSFNS